MVDGRTVRVTVRFRDVHDGGYDASEMPDSETWGTILLDQQLRRRRVRVRLVRVRGVLRGERLRDRRVLARQRNVYESGYAWRRVLDDGGLLRRQGVPRGSVLRFHADGVRRGRLVVEWSDPRSRPSHKPVHVSPVHQRGAERQVWVRRVWWHEREDERR